MRSKRLAGLFLVCVFLLSSCGGEDGRRAGVGVRSINTNVGLGVEVQAAAPAAILVPRPLRSIQEPSATLPPFEFEVPPKTTRPCPEAGPFDFPALDTGVEPQGRPAAGNYDWKLDGTVTTGDGVFTVDVFETRKIHDVQDHPSIPGAFTFVQDQEFLFDARSTRGGTLSIRYRVVPDPAIQQEQLPNDAGKGLFIESFVYSEEDPQGRETRIEFNPVPAIQLLAYPVKDGTAIDSTGTDPATTAQLTVRGIVKGKKQVDACGQRVDSWFIDAEQIFRYTDDRNGQTETLGSNYDYGVAPQYGSMIVFEHIDAPMDGPAVRIDSRVGRVPAQGGPK